MYCSSTLVCSFLQPFTPKFHYVSHTWTQHSCFRSKKNNANIESIQTHIILPCQITTLPKVRYHIHTANASNEVCTPSNYDDLDNTIVYHSSVTTDNFSLRIGEIVCCYLYQILMCFVLSMCNLPSAYFISFSHSTIFHAHCLQ